VTHRLTLLGTGGPKPDPDRQGPALLVQGAGSAILFDAGRGVATRLLQAGQNPVNLDAVFLTHHHFDHIGGLADLLLAIWNSGRVRPLPVFGPVGTREIIEATFATVYRSDIRFREREREAKLTGDHLQPIAPLFPVSEVDEGEIVTLKGCSISCERVSHGHGLGIDFAEFPCLGYRIEMASHVLAVSGDTVECDGLDRLADGADTLVLCCFLAQGEQTRREREIVSRYVLLSSAEAGKVAARAGAQRLVLTHIRRKSPSILQDMAEEISRDFNGEIILGTDLMALGL